MKALWISITGQRFEVEGNDFEEIKAKIEELRLEHNIPQPDAMVAGRVDGEPEDFPGTIDAATLPPHLQEHLAKKMQEAFNTPDPKDMN